ncbi:hypothetical protein SDC9_80205 [bioreactor metagenome]|uniref:Uncharacterized protein n=1 Tax=bioreactor metagenome TaxID=1076179 RepID=A0A644Z003_9ZZZZ
MVEDAKAGIRGAGGGDGWKGEEGLPCPLGQHLGGVDGLSAAHGENHVRVLRVGGEPLDIFNGGLSPVPQAADHLHRRSLQRGNNFLLRCRHGLFAPDHHRFCSVGGADGRNPVIRVRADGVAWNQCSFHFLSPLNPYSPDFPPEIYGFCKRPRSAWGR